MQHLVCGDLVRDVLAERDDDGFLGGIEFWNEELALVILLALFPALEHRPRGHRAGEDGRRVHPGPVSRQHGLFDAGSKACPPLLAEPYAQFPAASYDLCFCGRDLAGSRARLLDVAARALQRDARHRRQRILLVSRQAPEGGGSDAMLPQLFGKHLPRCRLRCARIRHHAPALRAGQELVDAVSVKAKLNTVA